jgi:ABC-type enterochelin transport system substrate-binding protein
MRRASARPHPAGAHRRHLPGVRRVFGCTGGRRQRRDHLRRYLELPFFAPLVADAARVGACSEPNLEAILALASDLIIASIYDDEGVREQLARIAPTVVMGGDDAPDSYRQTLRDVGALVGMEAEAAAYLDAFRCPRR